MLTRKITIVYKNFFTLSITIKKLLISSTPLVPRLLDRILRFIKSFVINIKIPNLDSV